ncbi:MAG: G/U mismatch-specific DNA glycosylase [Acidimicrobiia bacterium]|nr:G/U mismatch-specific DNA glycosylase [Acidimicrobiia bacterium]
MARFTKAELQTFYGVDVPDLVGPDLRLLFCGINPGLWTAATQTHFASPNNRFYPALHAAGLTDQLISRSDPITEDDRAHLIERGIGITNIVNKATARADELSREDLHEGARAVEAFVLEHQPKVIAILGVTAYRTAWRRPKAARGLQDEAIGGTELWVLGNPSGLNAHETVESLAEDFRVLAGAAGIEAHER